MPQPFNPAVITDNGIHLLTRAQAGEIKIEFTRIETGNGIYEEHEKGSEVLRTKTGLKSAKNSFGLSGIKVHSENSVKVSALITNYNSVTQEIIVTEGYYINEIGLYAREKDGMDNTEVLYSIAVTSGIEGDFMPPYNGADPVEIIQDYYVTVDSSEEVTVQGDNRVPALAVDLQQAEEKMSVMKEKLDGIDENANNYTHPTTAGNKHIPSGGSAGQVLKYGGSSGTASWDNGSCYGTCPTAAATAAKTVSLPGFSLFTGATVAVMFSNGNTAANPTLNVNSTGAKAIYYRNAALTASTAGIIAKNGVYLFVYSGSYWRLVGDVGSIALSEVADKLSTPRTIDGVSFDGSADVVHFGTCNTAASSTAKFVSIPGFQLIQGAIVVVYFAAGNSVENPTLNVSNTGAKDIVDKDGVITGNKKDYIRSRATYCLVYTGGLWELDAKIDTNRNTVSFTNADAASPTAWTDVSVLSSGLTHSTLFNRISTMFRNVRYLYKLLGKTDISAIGDGSVTGAINKIHTDLSDLNAKSYSGWFRQKIGNMVEINAVAPLTISGTLSESTGTYFHQAFLTIPAQIRPTDGTHMNVQSTVQSPGVFNSTFVGYNNGSGILSFQIATWKPFQNADIKLHVRIRFNE